MAQTSLLPTAASAAASAPGSAPEPQPQPQPEPEPEFGYSERSPSPATVRRRRERTQALAAAAFTGLTLSNCANSEFDGQYHYAGEANGKPHWKSEIGCHLYWGPDRAWLLRTSFQPDSPTASACCWRELKLLGDSEFRWLINSDWVPSFIHIEQLSDQKHLMPGDTVRITGLVNKPEFNDLKAEVVRYVAAKVSL